MLSLPEQQKLSRDMIEKQITNFIMEHYLQPNFILVDYKKWQEMLSELISNSNSSLFPTKFPTIDDVELIYSVKNSEQQTLSQTQVGLYNSFQVSKPMTVLLISNFKQLIVGFFDDKSE